MRLGIALVLACAGLAGCDEGVLTEDGHFLVDLGEVVMQSAHEPSPLLIAQNSSICPEVVAQSTGTTFSSVADPECFTLSGGDGACWTLRSPGLHPLAVTNTGGCASMAAQDFFALDVVEWSEIDAELRSVYDDAFAAVLTDEEGVPVQPPPPSEDGVITVLEGGRVLLRGVLHRAETFVAYDGATTRLTTERTEANARGELVVSANDAGSPLVLMTPDGPRTLGEVRAAAAETVDDLQLVLGWTQDDGTPGRHVYGLRVVARDRGGAVLHGAPVLWRVLEGDDVALLPSVDAPDFVEISGGCAREPRTATPRLSVVQASLGARVATASIEWRDAGSLGEAGAWRPDPSCIRSENPPDPEAGCGCNTASTGSFGWALLGMLFVAVRRTRRYER